jgi:serine/threonine-protein kinase
LSSVDPGLAPFDPLLAHALARDPSERFQTAEQFAEAIEEAAPALGGLAKAREVAQLVRDYAAEKLARDAELIRSAIAQVTARGSISAPAPVQEHAPAVIEVPLQPAPLQDVSPSQSIPEVSYDEIDVTELEEPQSRRLLWVVVVIFLAAAAGATAALWTRVPALLTGRTVPTTSTSTATPSDVPTQHTDSAADTNNAAQRELGPHGEATPSAANTNAAPSAASNDTPNSAARGREPAGATAANGRDEQRPTATERSHERPRPHNDAQSGPSNATSVSRDNARPSTTPAQPPASAPKPHRPRDADPSKGNSSGEEMLPNPYYR